MKIIFLDVDGVLNDIEWFYHNKYIDIDEEKVKLLAEIYHRTDAKIVLSSTWREMKSYNDNLSMKTYQMLVDILAKYKMEIIDHTPVHDMIRPLEIKEWLGKHPEVDKYASLDDDFRFEQYEEYGIGNCLVKTSFYARDGKGGLQPEHVEKAIQILNGGK